MTKRRMFAWWAISVLSCTVLASGQSARQVGDEREQKRVTSSEATIPLVASSGAAESLLRTRIDSIDWIDKTFEEVLDWLRDQGDNRVNIVPKWGPLGIENVNRESLVNLQLNNTTVADVLNEVLDQLSEDGEVRYRGIANKLTISTRQDFERKLFVRVYDATDLLFRVPDFGRDAPIIDLQRTSTVGAGGGGGGQSVFGGAGGGQSSQEDNESGQQAEQQVEQRLGKLRELIQKTIAPETWDLTGIQGAATQASSSGGRGRIEIFGRSLVIYNTIEVHEAIAGAFSLGE